MMATRSPPRTCWPRSRASVDPTSPLRGNLPAYKSAKIVDDHTIDVEITDNYPLLLNDLTNIVIFDKEWLVANNAEKPTDFGKGVEGYATNHANGTGPFEITERKPDAADGVREEPELVGQAAAQYRQDHLHADHLAGDARRGDALGRDRLHQQRAAAGSAAPAGRPDLKVLATNELRTMFYLSIWTTS